MASMKVSKAIFFEKVAIHLQRLKLDPQLLDAYPHELSGGMASAPRDGSRILVTIRPSEQGPAEVDLAYWSNGDQFGAEGWRASDSSPGHIIEYAEPELKCWMPMPSANRTSMPSPWEGDDDQELYGSGI